MPDNQTYPYDDDFMRFDNDLNQYVLTEAALLKFGVDIRARLSATSNIAPENEINYAVYRVSNLIYGYIHDHNANNPLQDFYIAHCPSLRQVMFKAMIAQLLYMFRVGALDDSTDEKERGMAITNEARRELNRTVPELGVCILYTGTLPRWCCYGS